MHSNDCLVLSCLVLSCVTLIADSADTAHEGSKRQNASSSASASIGDRPSRTSTSSIQATSSVREREMEREDIGRSPDNTANHQSSPMGTDNDSKKNKRKRNAVYRGGEEVDGDYVPNGSTYTKAQKEFNRMAALKDPLPGIIADMAIAPVASRIVHRRSSRHSGAPAATEYGETGTRKSPKDAPPVNTRPLSARKGSTKTVQEDDESRNEEEDDEDDEDEDEDDEDEVLTEDQDSIPAKGSRASRCR